VVFRFEFLAKWKDKKPNHPLSSDAFTGFGRDNAREHNAEVEGAYWALRGEESEKFLDAIRKSSLIPSQKNLIRTLYLSSHLFIFFKAKFKVWELT